jgi:hypothetical protein
MTLLITDAVFLKSSVNVPSSPLKASVKLLFEFAAVLLNMSQNLMRQFLGNCLWAPSRRFQNSQQIRRLNYGHVRSV